LDQVLQMGAITYATVEQNSYGENGMQTRWGLVSKSGAKTRAKAGERGLGHETYEKGNDRGKQGNTKKDHLGPHKIIRAQENHILCIMGGKTLAKGTCGTMHGDQVHTFPGKRSNRKRGKGCAG